MFSYTVLVDSGKPNRFDNHRIKMSGWNNLFFAVAGVSLVIDVDAFGKGPESDSY